MTYDARWPHCPLCGEQFTDVEGSSLQTNGAYLQCECGNRMDRPIYDSPWVQE